MNAVQVKHMVDRFLGWRLPKSWNPDNGISYKRPNFAHAPAEHDWPIGTNLFSATEADGMVRHMLEGMPVLSKAEISTRIQRRLQGIPAANGGYMSLAPTTLRDVLSRELFERICDAAAEVALSEKE